QPGPGQPGPGAAGAPRRGHRLRPGSALGPLGRGAPGRDLADPLRQAGPDHDGDLDAGARQAALDQLRARHPAAHRGGPAGLRQLPAARLPLHRRRLGRPPGQPQSHQRPLPAPEPGRDGGAQLRRPHAELLCQGAGGAAAGRLGAGRRHAGRLPPAVGLPAQPAQRQRAAVHAGHVLPPTQRHALPVARLLPGRHAGGGQHLGLAARHQPQGPALREQRLPRFRHGTGTAVRGHRLRAARRDRVLRVHRPALTPTATDAARMKKAVDRRPGLVGLAVPRVQRGASASGRASGSSPSASS
ncbi:conserved hypothetical protein, partial [Ricinus communis]